MRPVEFKEANTKLLPPEGEEDRVVPLPIWRHPEGGMVISKWRMGWGDRLRVLMSGVVWVHAWGNTHPPISPNVGNPFETKLPFGLGMRRSVAWVIFLALIAIASIILTLYQELAPWNSI